MARKHLYEYIFQYFQKNNYLLLDTEYIGANERLTIKDDEGYLYHISFNCFNSGKKFSKFVYKPEKFSKRNKYTFKNIGLWVSANNRSFELCGGEYIDNRHDTLIFQCKKCQEKWNTSLDDIYCKKCSCPYCAGKRVSITKNLETDFPEIAKQWDYDKNQLLPSQYTKGSSKKVFWLCSEGHRWESTISNRTTLGEGCPICEESHGEQRIRRFLEKHRLNIDSQKTFINCKGVSFKPLSFDFCVYRNCGEVFSLIEFQGKQHYMSIEYFGGNDGYLKRQMYDIYKAYYCNQNNYKLIAIPYWDFDKIEEILERELLPLLEGREKFE